MAYQEDPRNVTITELIIANSKLPPDEQIGCTQLATRIGCSPTTVWRLTTRLRHEGVIPPSPRQKSKAVKGPATVKVSKRPQGGRLDLSKLLTDATLEPTMMRNLDSEVIMDDLTRLKLLSRIARTAGETAKIQALKALEEFSRASGNRVGPPEPLTDDQRVARLARIMLAIGSSLSHRALSTAFPPSDTTAPQIEAPDVPQNTQIHPSL